MQINNQYCVINNLKLTYKLYQKLKNVFYVFYELLILPVL
jgi:hypothetical protein